MRKLKKKIQVELYIFKKRGVVIRTHNNMTHIIIIIITIVIVVIIAAAYSNNNSHTHDNIISVVFSQ